ncbi:MAG: type III-B CRISPR module RAMP protein Cmr6 [Acidobacteriia bacterium]|nr:type III-B CRISPR module RAMP protein Cmr6 [Terriglobia bacterium]
MQACRNAVVDVNRGNPRVSHPGLLLSRYLRIGNSGQDKTDHQDDKRKLLDDTRQAAATAGRLYQHFFQQWHDNLPPSTRRTVLSVQGRLIIGLGADNVLETGITLHHTYGVPLIPGSALKGLAAHYCDQVWGEAESKFNKRGESYKILFGAELDSGHIIFYDAWIDPASLTCRDNLGLVLDVMTPHHGEYYSGKNHPPSDFDDPNPIQFLSVSGNFHFAVAADVDSEDGLKWAQLALDLLQEALANWGVGGKTSSGYGRLRPSTAQLSGEAASYIPQKPNSKPAAIRYKRGDRIRVKRIEDIAGRGKVRFQAEDGTIGHFGKPEFPPNAAVGESVEVWVANVGADTYMLTLRKPAPKQGRSSRGERGSRR